MNPLVRISMRNGLLAGALGFGLIVVLYYIDRHPLLIPPYLDFRIILFGVFIFFTLREIREYHYGGILYFWQGMISGFLFTVAYAAVSFFALQLFAYAVPEFLSEYVRLSMEHLKSFPPEAIESMGQEAYERNLELLPTTDTTDLAVLHVVQSFVISLFISIVLSVVLRKQPKE